MNDDDSDVSEIDDELSDEPIGSCENCGCNVYEDEHFGDGDYFLCDQCEWWRTQA